ncbi:MAG TPA: helix-turn-helix transcriptional regulator [Pyrinomonadaceae bacterium]|nr:helix-turn-helix transcriptional regulator [Pyrinomonadaceae bacterium]
MSTALDNSDSQRALDALSLSDELKSDSCPEQSGGEHMALLALSHTPVEHRLYEAMLGAVAGSCDKSSPFSVRRLMALTGIMSYPMVRRGRDGLLKKLSIQNCDAKEAKSDGSLFYVFNPQEIFERRRASGLEPYPKELEERRESSAFMRAVERVVRNHHLSRREAQVALLCAQGLRNKEIAERLFITAATAKYHLRNIYAKFDVTSKALLISHLLSEAHDAKAQESRGDVSRALS